MQVCRVQLPPPPLPPKKSPKKAFLLFEHRYRNGLSVACVVIMAVSIGVDLINVINPETEKKKKKKKGRIDRDKFTVVKQVPALPRYMYLFNSYRCRHGLPSRGKERKESRECCIYYYFFWTLTSL